MSVSYTHLDVYKRQAHTYMAAENLENMGRKLGIPLKAETNGSAGADNVLTAEEIKNAEDVYKRQHKANVTD